MSVLDKSKDETGKQSYSSTGVVLDDIKEEGSSGGCENFPVIDDKEKNEVNSKNVTSETETAKNEGETSKSGENISKRKGDTTEKRELKSQKKGKVTFQDELDSLTYERLEDNTVINPFNNKHVRLIVCGEPNVGKTSVIERFITGNFTEDRNPTVGMEFTTSTVKWGPCTSIEVEFWDMHGNRLESFVASDSCHVLDAGIIVYDCTRPETLHIGATLWISALRDLFERNNVCEKVPLTLIGNKCDLLPRPTITYHDLCSYSYMNNVEGWFVASARENIEVENAITFAIRSAMQRLVVTEEEEVKKGFYHSTKEAIGKVGRKLRHPFSK